MAHLDGAAFRAVTTVRPKFVSPSDPAAQWTGALRDPAFFTYAINYLIDTQEARLASIVAACTLNDVNPLAHIADTLSTILDGHLPGRIEDLLPWRFRRASDPGA